MIPVPGLSKVFLLAARLADGFAVRQVFLLPGFQAPSPLTLQPEHNRVLRVQVVDPAGEPVSGVTVSLVGRHQCGEVHFSSVRSREPDGIAEFHHLTSLIGAPFDQTKDASFEVILAAPRSEAVGFPLALDE